LNARSLTESDPGPLDVRAEARKQARILAAFRALKERTLRERRAGTWRAPGLVPLARRRTRGKGHHEAIPGAR
jgi:hypothetical protein